MPWSWQHRAPAGRGNQTGKGRTDQTQYFGGISKQGYIRMGGRSQKISGRMEKQLEENATKRYSIFQLLIIFLASPLILIGKIDYDQSVTDLKQENFKIKAKQRIIALIAGTLVYILTFYVLINN